jgi:cation:H+ antiporter
VLVLWLEFILCSGVIVISGIFLSRYGDIIAEKTGLGRAWIGLILMAGVTSLPELINGISSVTVADVPDIALGDIMGSCIFNISIIAILDLFHGPQPIFSKAEHGHILSAGFGVILIGIPCISILAGSNIPAIGHIGIYTPVIIFIYFIAVRSVYFHEKRTLAERVGELVETKMYDHVSVRAAVVKYTLNAVVIVVAATLLPFIGARIAEETGLGQSFVGTFFIGLTTSLPELAVSLSALSIGATDMAIANLFGSNLFNIFILAIDDIFYTDGPILSSISTSHAVAGFMAVLMTGIAVVALTYRLRKKTLLRLSWDTIALILAYCVSFLLLYSLR